MGRINTPYERFTTQSQVNTEIERRIIRGERYEQKRDAQQHESKRYWRYHDIATKWFELAADLMP